MTYRVFISALIVGLIATGNTLQAVLSNGVAPSKWQIWSAVIGGAVLALNDIKSRWTPVEATNIATINLLPQDETTVPDKPKPELTEAGDA